MRPNVACKCINTHWAPVHLFTGPPSQEPTPCPIRDLRANENVSLVPWVSADAGHKGKNIFFFTETTSSKSISPILMTSLHQFFAFHLNSVLASWVPISSRVLAVNHVLRFPIGIHQLDRERGHFILGRMFVCPFGSPGVAEQIADVWTTCLVQVTSQQKNKGHPSSQSCSWTLKLSPFMTF